MKKLLILLVLFGCSSAKDEETLNKSMEIHEEALKISAEVKEKIKQIEASSSSLPDSVMMVFTDSVSALNSAWDEWESSIVEVPGRDHEDHDHDHHDHGHEGHDHSPAPDLTPEMVLEIQQDLKNRINSLNIRTQNILDTLPKE